MFSFSPSNFIKNMADFPLCFVFLFCFFGQHLKSKQIWIIVQKVEEFVTLLFWESPHFGGLHCFFRGCFPALEDIVSARVSQADHITPLFFFLPCSFLSFLMFTLAVQGQTNPSVWERMKF